MKTICIGDTMPPLSPNAEESLAGRAPLKGVA